MIASSRLFEMPISGLYPVEPHEANALLVRWGHKLGPCERPYHQEGFALEVDGVPVAVAMSASIVNGPVGSFGRFEVVELARLAAANPWANRVMLRLWRELCAPRWKGWEVKAAVSYSHNGMHSGNIYRFDGWEKIRDDAGGSRGGGGRRVRDKDETVNGKKTLWLYRYDPPPTEAKS